MKGCFTMLELICSCFLLILLFFVVSFILVKLYDHFKIRDWFVQIVLVAFGLWYFFSRPAGYVFSGTEKWIAFVVLLASILTIDRSHTHVKPYKSKTKTKIQPTTQVEPQDTSFFKTFLSALVVWSIWDYFTDDE